MSVPGCPTPDRFFLSGIGMLRQRAMFHDNLPNPREEARLFIMVYFRLNSGLVKQLYVGSPTATIVDNNSRILYFRKTCSSDIPKYLFFSHSDDDY
jgi:hypothetical protein